MRINLVVASYLRIAAEDLAGAKLLAEGENRNAIYLCSQAAEKVIRAVLTTEGKHAGIGHQLVQMVDMVPTTTPSSRCSERSIRWVTSRRHSGIRQRAEK